MHSTVFPVEYPFKNEEEVLNYDPRELVPESVEELTEKYKKDYKKMLKFRFGKLSCSISKTHFCTSLELWFHPEGHLVLRKKLRPPKRKK